jgi:uncharacterized ParB-like nuclease family protein
MQQAPSEIRSIPVTAIRVDGGTQSRVSLSEETTAEYASKIGAGETMPPIVLFHDGSTYWLADGFHRVMAHRKVGVESITADVRIGTRRDAVLHSVGANSSHGLPRTNADKRRSVEMLLADTEWAAWSDREIARRCAVTHTFVGRIREPILETNTSITSRTFTHPKTGTESVMRTENIGRRVNSVQREPAPVSAPSPEQRPTPLPQSRGVGLGYAHKAIAALQQIPLNDGLRDEAMDTVAQWISDNR